MADDDVPGRQRWRSDRRTLIAFSAAALGAIVGAGSSEAVDRVDRRSASPGSVLLQGTGIDPSGRRSSTAAVQRVLDKCPDHGVVIVPPGARVLIDGPVHIRRAMTLVGAGEIVVDSGIEHAAAIDIRASDCTVIGLRLTAHGDLGASDGDASFGLRVHASRVSVLGCRITGFQNGIAVAADGEFHDILISDNDVLEVRGAGGGRGSSSAAGEDRGDGIVVWGSAVVVSGNRVTAAPGTDARIGIHIEALSAYVRVQGALNAAACSVTGNVVSGQFRRGIANEGVSNASFCGNVVADSTWWALSVSGAARGCAVTGNTVRWTSTPEDDQGAAWSPVRSALMVYGAVSGTTFGSNAIDVVTGSALPTVIAIQAPDADHRSQAVSFSHTVLSADPGTVETGVRIVNGSDGTELHGNILSGLSGPAMSIVSAEGCVMSDNTLTVTTTTSSNVIVEGPAITSCTMSGNRISGGSVGIDVRSGVGILCIENNRVASETVGVTLGSSRSVVAIGNILIGPRGFDRRPSKSFRSVSNVRVDR